MSHTKTARWVLASVTAALWATSAPAQDAASTPSQSPTGESAQVNPCPAEWEPTAIKVTETNKTTEAGQAHRVSEFSCGKKEATPSRWMFALPFILELHHQNTSTYRWIAGPPTEAGASTFTLEKTGPRLSPGVIVAPSVRLNLFKDSKKRWVWASGGLGISLASLGATGLGDRLTLRPSIGWDIFTLSVGIGRAYNTELASAELAALSGQTLQRKKEELPELTRAEGRVWTKSVGFGIDLAAASEGLSKTFAFLTGVFVGK